MPDLGTFWPGLNSSPICAPTAIFYHRASARAYRILLGPERGFDVQAYP